MYVEGQWSYRLLIVGVIPWRDSGSVCMPWVRLFEHARRMGCPCVDGCWPLGASTTNRRRHAYAWYRPHLPPHAHLPGMFRDGEKHGSGCLRTVNGDTLEGEWIKSKPQEGDVSFLFVCFRLRSMYFVCVSTYYNACPICFFCFLTFPGAGIIIIIIIRDRQKRCGHNLFAVFQMLLLVSTFVPCAF